MTKPIDDRRPDHRDRAGRGRALAGARRVLAVAVLAGTLAACGGGDDQSAGADVQNADEVQVMSPEEAQAVLAEGADRAGEATRVEAGTDADTIDTADTVGVSESSRSFQTRFGTALTTFNVCLQDEGFEFIGLPGQSTDPAASDPAYLAALITCNSESGIGDIVQEQQARQADLTADQKTELNTTGRKVFECLGDRGWDFGELEANENGILNATTFPNIPAARQDEFQRDLDECGWNDLDLG